MENNVRCRAYIRIGVKKHYQGIQIDTQMKRIQSYCDFKNWELLQVYKDDGVNGRSMDRLGLQTLISQIQPGETIIITELSRLSRNIKDLLDMLDNFKSRHIHFVCLTPDINTNNMVGQMFSEAVGWLKSIDKQEKPQSPPSRIRKRAPIGYKCVGRDKDLEPIPEQLRMIERIKEMYVSGQKLSHIARQLNEEGENKCLSLNKKDQNRVYMFHADTVRRILIDEGVITGTTPRVPIDERIVSPCKT